MKVYPRRDSNNSSNVCVPTTKNERYKFWKRVENQKKYFEKKRSDAATRSHTSIQEGEHYYTYATARIEVSPM